jgi:acyl-CoA thioester hydrolase
MLASANFSFRKPLFYPGNIVVKTRMEFIKNTSFGFQHIMLDEKEEIAMEAHDVMVMFDFNTNEKINFPENLKIAVEKLEGKKY